MRRTRRQEEPSPPVATPHRGVIPPVSKSPRQEQRFGCPDQHYAVIQKAVVDTPGAIFIDTNATGAAYSALGHDVCQQPVIGNGSWFNSLLNSNPPLYSFHPNATGQQMMELALVAHPAGPRTQSAIRPAPSPLTAPQLADLASLPTSGPGLSITLVPLGSSGSTQTIAGDGFAPGSAVQVSALTPGDLGSVTAGAKWIGESQRGVPPRACPGSRRHRSQRHYSQR